MQNEQCSYILSLAGYLENREYVSHADLIEQELHNALVQTQSPDLEGSITCALLRLGHPRFLRTWIDLHGLNAISSGAPKPLHFFMPKYGSELAIEALELIAPLLKPASKDKDTIFNLYLIASRIDSPDFLEKAARALDIEDRDLYANLASSIFWDQDCPNGKVWTARLLETRYDPKDPAWQEMTKEAVAKNNFPLLAAIVKLGGDIRSFLPNDHIFASAKWWKKITNGLSSSHSRISLMKKLPPVEECLSLSASQVVKYFSSK